jgi:hypothetical protein
MEELLKNFVHFIGNCFNKQLGDDMNNYLISSLKDNNYSDLNEVELKLKKLFKDFLKRSDINEFNNISQCLYINAVDQDDRNLIRGIKFLIRLYGKFQELILRKRLYQWRMSLYMKIEGNNKMRNTENQYHKREVSSYKEKPIPNNQNNRILNQQSKLVQQSISSQKEDIFNKLYNDAFKKEDKRLLNDDLKNLEEINECTFQPNKFKKI